MEFTEEEESELRSEAKKTLRKYLWRNMAELSIKDSGQRDVYPTGAQRDNHALKGRFDLMSGPALLRLARWYEMGGKKYEDRNWEKGINNGRYVDAILRHTVKYMMGADDEDHLAAIAWNAFALMFNDYYKPELNDLPEWKDRTTKWNYQVDKE